MHRRNVLLIPVLLSACGKPARDIRELLPAEAGDWKRGEVTTPAPQIAETAASLGVDASAEALYTGQGRIRVRVLRMKAETVAFELRQKWRQSDGLGAYQGPYFFAAQAEEGATQDSVMQVLGLLQKAAAS